MNYRVVIICNVIHDNADETILTSIALFLSETIQYNLNYLNIMNYRVVIICNVIHGNADDKENDQKGYNNGVCWIVVATR